MGILTRYILKAHLGPFFFALSVLTGILLVNTIAKRLEGLAGRGLSWSVMAEVFLLSFPHILALTLPMAVLVATLYAFTQLASENEVTALKASGINLNRLLIPLVIAATLFGGGMVWFNDRLLPETNHELKVLLLDIQRKSPTLTLKKQTLNPIRTDGSARARYYLLAGDIRSATNQLWDVTIWDFSEPDQNRTVYADSGVMAFNDEQTDLFLMLHDGWVNQLDQENPGRFVRTYFDQYQIQIRGVGNELTRTQNAAHRTDREMTLGMLRAEADSARSQASSLRAQIATIGTDAIDRILGGPTAAAAPSAGDSRRRGTRLLDHRYGAEGAVFDDVTRRAYVDTNSLEGRAELMDRRYNEYQVEYHKKFAISWAVIVFVLLGAPLAVRFPRGGVGLVIAASIGIFAVYYAGLIGGESLGDNGTVPPWLAMWGPNILFFLIAIWGLSRIGKEGATTRGGGWEDMSAAIKGMAAAPFRALRRSALPRTEEAA
jgi:lipopolysaccharide export system permease protein